MSGYGLRHCVKEVGFGQVAGAVFSEAPGCTDCQLGRAGSLRRLAGSRYTPAPQTTQRPRKVSSSNRGEEEVEKEEEEEVEEVEEVEEECHLKC